MQVNKKNFIKAAFSSHFSWSMGNIISGSYNKDGSTFVGQPN
jgi:hypothetical protein